MAVSQSTLVSNEQAKPIVYNHVGLYGARLRSIICTDENTGSDGDFLIMAKLHPEWRIAHMWWYNDTMSGAADVDVGLYSDADATSISDAAKKCYAEAYNTATAKTTGPVDIAYKSRAIENMGQYVYQDAGHTTATKLNEYYLGVELVDAGAAGTIVINVQFTVD